jgi:hypothetical protein
MTIELDLIALTTVSMAVGQRILVPALRSAFLEGIRTSQWAFTCLED